MVRMRRTQLKCSFVISSLSLTINIKYIPSIVMGNLEYAEEQIGH